MTTLTQEEKIAILLRGLAPEALESVLAKLKPEHQARLRALAQKPIQSATGELLAPVLREFESMLPKNGVQPAPAVPSQSKAAAAYASAAGAPPVDDKEADASADPLADLYQVDPEDLALALQGENPRTVCLILKQLPLEAAGQLFKRLSGDLRRMVSVHFAAMPPAPAEIMQRIAYAVVRKSRQLKNKPPERGPEACYRDMASMVRLLDKPDRKDVIAALEEHDAAAAAAVKGMLYRFDDLLKIENRSMQRLLGELDTKNLSLALKGADSAVVQKVLSNMSQRAQQSLNEEMDLGGTPGQDQIEQARKVIVETIQRLDQSGGLVMTEG